jgi:RNA polymerase sigma factor (sigma-70 family)
MAATQTGIVVRHIRELVSADARVNLPDTELLGRFTAARDEAAFAALVRRHGGLVLGVCRRVLGNHADAEDAFQATFLVLARKAASIARQAALPSWLYQVAYRVAVKAKAQAATRQKHECRAEERTAADPLAEITGRELLGVLDEELQALGERQRAPLLLCYLQGHTCDEAARRLGCSARTLKRWLDQGRRCLARRLARRGLTLPAALLATGLSEAARAAEVPARLATASAQAALRITSQLDPATGVAPVSAAAVALAESVSRGAPALKLYSAALVFLFAGMLAVGAGTLAGVAGSEAAQRPPAGGPREQVAAAAPFSPLLPMAWPGKGVPAPTPGKPDRPGGVTVSARVLNADGKPLAKAAVALVGFIGDTHRGGDLNAENARVLAQGQTDPEGRLRLAAPGASLQEVKGFYVLARAPGHALGLERLKPGQATFEVSLSLKPERVVRGRLVDLQGQPADGVTVSVGWVGRLKNGLSEGMSSTKAVRSLAVWPETVRTDAQGRFVVRGLAPTGTASLVVEDARYAPQAMYFDGKEFDKEINRSLAPAQLIEGRVLQADTGKPVPHALLTVYSSDQELGSYAGLGGKADAEGRFRLNPNAGKWFTVSAHAPEGEPYLALEQRFKWPAGKVSKQLDLKLPRGVLVRGKITEADSGKPVKRAAVQYYPLSEADSRPPKGLISGWQGTEVSKADGAFHIPVLPGKGYLLIIGPDGRYIHEEIGNMVLFNGRPGGTRYYPDALVKLDLPKETRGKDVAVTLRRGVSVKGRLVGPGGEPVGKALMICRLHVTALSPFWRFPVEVRDGQFELHGLDPEKSCPVAFLEPEKRWGTTMQLSGKHAGKEVTVKLQPCGQAVARFLDAQGKPQADHRPMLDIVVTPGAHRYDFKAAEKGQLAADQDFLANIDRHNYWKGPVTDAEGRCTFPALIPGVTYRFSTYRKGMHTVARDFTVEAGKTFDAGDITTSRPD